MNKYIEISININQIIVFIDLYNQLNWFLNEINKEEYNKVYDDNDIILDNEDIRRIKVNEIMEKKKKINKEKNKIKNT